MKIDRLIHNALLDNETKYLFFSFVQLDFKPCLLEPVHN